MLRLDTCAFTITLLVDDSALFVKLVGHILLERCELVVRKQETGFEYHYLQYNIRDRVATFIVLTVVHKNASVSLAADFNSSPQICRRPYI